MRKDFYAAILSGGSGERFWPLSTPERPKQFLSVFGGKSLLRQSVERLKGVVPPERILIVTGKALDALHPSLKPVAMIHDVEWSESDGRRETFDESNERFRRNGITVARESFGWWRPRRYKVMWDAVKFARLCQTFGFGAFYAPYKARMNGGAA